MVNVNPINIQYSTNMPFKFNDHQLKHRNRVDYKKKKKDTTIRHHNKQRFRVRDVERFIYQV